MNASEASDLCFRFSIEFVDPSDFHKILDGRFGSATHTFFKGLQIFTQPNHHTVMDLACNRRIIICFSMMIHV